MCALLFNWNNIFKAVRPCCYLFTEDASQQECPQILLYILGSIPLVLFDCAIRVLCVAYLISSKGHVKLEHDINDTVKVSSDIEVKVVDVISKRFYTIADPFNFGNSPNPDSQNNGLLKSLYVCLAREWSHFKLIKFIISATIFGVSNRLSWLVIWNPICFRII